MTRDDRRAAAAAAGATLLGSAALLPVFTTTAWVRPVLSVVLAVWAGGLLLRTGGERLWQRAFPGRPVPRPLEVLGALVVPAVQLGLVLCVLTVFYAPEDAFWRLVPTTTSVGDLVTVLADGSAELQEQATPALPLTGLVALTTVLVAVVAVAVDLIAVTGRQAALAGLGLLGLYCVPVSTVTGGIGLAAVVAPAAGFALLLWADQRRRLAATSRPVARAVTGGGSRAALRVGVLALLAGILLGSVLPTLREGSFGTGLGGGTGAGGTLGNSLDPVAALQGQLQRPEQAPLLSMRTDVEDPGFLRAVALDQYDSDRGWLMSNLDGELSVEQPLLAPLPPEVDRRTVSARITSQGHDDRFLPVPWSPQSVSIQDPANWRFDPTTGTVFGRDTTTGNRTWVVSTDQPTPSPGALDRAPELDPGDPIRAQFTQLPELDPYVPALVAELTADAQTPYQRVRRILEYLSDRDNGFVYSLSTTPGTSGDDLVDFLRLKAGYCEQYAGAMAVLVRAAQVPARVALGYTPGQEQSDGSRLITTDDAHAWVEVYFDGIGWVPFDPTPISPSRAVDLPWAPRAGGETDSSSGSSAGQTAAPQAAPTPRTDRADGAIQSLSPTAGGSGWLRTALVAAGTVLLLAVVAAVPATARALQRRRRLAAGAPGNLWDELTATVTDLGVPLDPAWTPRQAAARLAESAGHGGDPIVADRAGEAVRRLALAEESASYGPGAEPDPERAAALREALSVARRGLQRSVPGWTRLRARLWPTSLVSAVAAATADRVRRLGELARAPRRSRPV